MATVKAYVTAMRSRQTTVARKLGCDITRANKGDRCLNVSLLVIVACIVKTLVDQGVVTDAQLTATFDAAAADEWDAEPPIPGGD